MIFVWWRYKDINVTRIDYAKFRYIMKAGVWIGYKSVQHSQVNKCMNKLLLWAAFITQDKIWANYILDLLMQKSMFKVVLYS